MCYNFAMSEVRTSKEEVKEDLEKRAIYENLEGKRVVFDPEIPTNHKWFIGEFHTASWGSDSSPFGGEPKDRVKVSMMGKKLRPETHNFIASVYGVISAVIDPKDREFIGRYGWWRTGDFSHASKKRGKV